MKRASMFLVAVVLLAAMVGCGSEQNPGPDAPLPYVLNITSMSGGSVTVTVEEEETVIGPGETEVVPDILAGTEVNLLANPTAGYEFVEWMGGPVDGITETLTTLNMQDNYEIAATFNEIPTYELVMGVSPVSSGTATDQTNASPYPEGTIVSIKAVPTEGYQFVDWTAPAGVFGNADEAETTFTVPGQAVTVTANFELIPPTYELTMAAAPELGGTAIDINNESPYAEGTIVSIEAVPAEGYQFVNWTAPAGVFGNADDAETTFSMPGQAVTVTANFELIPPTYELTMAGSPVGSGTATDETNGGPYIEGAIVSIKAIASQGYHFVHWTAAAGVFGNPNDAETTFTMSAEAVTVTATFAVEHMAAAGGFHTVGLQSEGTVLAVGKNESGQCHVGDWTNVVQVSAGYEHTVGVRCDGTVVAVGDNFYGQCDVSGWTNITQVAAGYRHTVGLKSDGTVVAVGSDSYGQCGVSGWTNITQVAAGYRHTVGLESDGTVVAAGSDSYGQCGVSGWTNIIQIAAGGYHTVGLTSDGTVLAVGFNDIYGQCNVGDWENIAQVAAGELHTVGLKSDATVLAVGENANGQCDVSAWADIVQVAAGYRHTVGLKSDGTVIGAGLNNDGQCDVDGWNLN
jgi:hypothetical protein